jgi:hypothetical protein
MSGWRFEQAMNCASRFLDEPQVLSVLYLADKPSFQFAFLGVEKFQF